jgi:hypothetical protein
LIPDLTYMLKLNEGTKQMSAINTVNTVDQNLTAYANDNAATTVRNNQVNDYNSETYNTVNAVVRPKSLADLIGHNVNDNK